MITNRILTLIVVLQCAFLLPNRFTPQASAQAVVFRVGTTSGNNVIVSGCEATIVFSIDSYGQKLQGVTWALRFSFSNSNIIGPLSPQTDSLGFSQKARDEFDWFLRSSWFANAPDTSHPENPDSLAIGAVSFDRVIMWQGSGEFYRLTFSPSDTGRIIIDSTTTPPVTHCAWQDSLGDDHPVVWQPETLFVIDASNNLAGYSPSTDGWRFANEVAELWPSSWWQQFDYSQPPYAKGYGFAAVPRDHFPDWPLFAETFGEAQVYFDPPPAPIVYRRSAVSRWRRLLGQPSKWGGSCYGLASTSLACFDGSPVVLGQLPGAARLYDIENSDNVRKVVNKYTLYQLGIDQRRDAKANWRGSPLAALDEIHAMFAQTTRDDRFLVMYSIDPSNPGAHAVIPYRCETDAYDPSIEYIYVYDSNLPGSTEPRIEFDKASTTWYYEPLDWGGTPGLVLAPPVSSLETKPRLYANQLNRAGHSTDDVDVYVSPADTTIFNGAAGTIGSIGDSIFADMTDGFPIIPVGGPALPIGYTLPSAEWSGRFGGYVDSLFSLSMVTEASILTYERQTLMHNETDILRSAGGEISALWVTNPDIASRTYNIEAISISPDSEIAVNVTGIELSASDSTEYTLTEDSRLRINNFGDSTSYELRIEIPSVSQNAVFWSGQIVLPGQYSHEIVSDWRPFGNLLRILIDSGMTGSFAETLSVASSCPISMTGDVNVDSTITSADIIHLVNYVFKSGSAPQPMPESGDVNCSETITSSDVITLVNYVFKDGPEPCDACSLL